MKKTSAIIIALAIELAVSPLKLFSQEKKSIFSDPFASAWKIINPASVEFSPSTTWTSLTYSFSGKNAGSALYFMNNSEIREGHSEFAWGGAGRIRMEFDGEETVALPQATLYAHLRSEYASVYPLLACQFELANNQISNLEYMVGVAASGKVWKLDLSGYGSYAFNTSKESSQGFIGGIGWAISTRLFDVEHAFQIDSREWERSLTVVATLLKRGGLIFEKETSADGKALYVGVLVRFGEHPLFKKDADNVLPRKESRFAGQAFVKFNVEGGFQPTFGIVGKILPRNQNRGVSNPRANPAIQPSRILN